MKKCLLLVFALICLLIPNYCNATHAFGAEISYKHIKDSKYQISIKVYRDCTGINLGGIAATVVAGTNTQTISFTKVGIKDVTPICKTYVSACKNQQSGLGIGVEEHLYIDTIDFSIAPYSTWKNNGACEFRIIWQQCCRNLEITNINGGNMYAETMINLCNIEKLTKKQNSSPTFTSDLTHYLCCNNPAYYNTSGVDSMDNDSIVYSLAAPMESPISSLAFKKSFSIENPTTAKCKNPKDVNCKAFPNTYPPLGFYLDPVKGDIIFTPSKCDEVAIVAIEANEYRKDTNGNYVHIGRTTRDLQFVTMNCASNHPPEIIAKKFDYTICEGDKITINMEGTDKPYSNSKKDTVTLSWDGALASNGTFTVSNDTNNREKKGVFEWQTKEGDANGLPYIFSVKAEDHACPLKSITSRAFSIKVVKKPQVLSKSIIPICDRLKVDVNVKQFYPGTISYKWELFDSATPTILLDRKTNKKDSFKITKASTYLVKLSINSYDNCSQIFWDTIKVTPVYNPLELGNDTTLSLIDSFILKAGANNKAYLWSNNSTDSNLVIRPIDLGSGTYNYKVEVTNNVGCKYYDSIKITIDPCKNNIAPIATVLKDNYTICAGELLDFNIILKDSVNDLYHRKDTTYLNYLSSHGELSLVDSQSLNKTGRFIWQTSLQDASDSIYTLSFEYYDDACPSALQRKNIEVSILQSPNAKMFNIVECGILKLNASLNTDFIYPVKYNWNIIDENTSNSVFSSALSNPEYKLLNSALYKTSLFIENGLGCTQELTETKTLSPYTNRELLGSDRILYISNTLDLKVENYSQYLWNDNSTSNFKNLKGIDLGLGKTIVGLVVMDRDGCQFSDSIEIDVQCSPNTLDIGGNQTVDKWDNITLSANSNYASYLWNDNTTKKSIDIKAHLLGAGVYNYSLKATDQYNCAYTDNMTLTVTDLVSIDDASKRTIKVYPTPTKDILQIDLPQSFKGGKLEIINLIGKVVLQKEIEGAKIGTYKLNIAHLPKGAYILKLSTSEGEFNFKIVKE